MPSVDLSDIPPVSIEYVKPTYTAELVPHYKLSQGSLSADILIGRKYEQRADGNAAGVPFNRQRGWTVLPGPQALVAIKADGSQQTGEERIIRRFADFEAQTQYNISALTRKIEALTRAVDILSAERPQEGGAYSYMSTQESALSKEDTQIREAENVAITLNDVADGLVIADAETKAIALTVLSGGDPAGRAAAGRAPSRSACRSG